MTGARVLPEADSRSADFRNEMAIFIYSSQHQKRQSFWEGGQGGKLRSYLAGAVVTA